VAARQQDAFGSLVTFELAGGLTAARALAGSLKHFTLAESLGGVESLVCHPATMTHASMTMEAQSAAGINAAQLRLSIGIEAERDLVGDLTRGLERLP
jgi:cystathionine gamma-synthase